MSWRRFWHRAKWDREKREELESYLDLETSDNIARGMPAAEARSAALRKLGNRTQIREEIYTMNTIGLLDMLSRDLRHVARMLHRNPVFSLVALLTLAIGIGANTAVFSVLNSVLLQPLPYPNAGELVALTHSAPGFSGLTSTGGDLRLSASMFVTYKENNRVFQSLGVWATGVMSVTGLAEPEEVPAVFLSEGMLPAFQVPPVLGRWLAQADHAPGAPDTVMLGHGYWQRRLGGDRSVIGRRIVVNSRPHEIVGVMPASFRVLDNAADLYAPLSFNRAELKLPGFGLQSVGRLKPGISLTAAESDIARLVPVWIRSWPGFPGVDPKVYERARIRPVVRPLKQEVVGSAGDMIWVVMATIAIVMLIASANVANLMLVRAEARRQEIAVRAALGAGRGRIVRELLVESLALALLGGSLGLALAGAGVQLIRSVGPASLPRLHEIAIDGWTIAFGLSVSLGAGLLCGIIPALQSATRDLSISAALRAGGRSFSHGREHRQVRSFLVVAQVALALVLLVGSGLMLRTFHALSGVEPGFTDPSRIQVLRITIPGSLVRQPEQVIRMQQAIVEKIKAIPGVDSAAFTDGLPLEGTPPNWDAIAAEGSNCLAGELPPMRIFKSASPALHQTVGTRLLAGRDFTWAGVLDGRRFVMVSENLARELWGSPAAAVGKRISTCIPGAPLFEVIGVVQNVRDNGVHEPAPAIVYWPSYGPSPYAPGRFDLIRSVSFAIRSPRAGTSGFLEQLNQAVWSINASLPVASVRTVEDIYRRSLARTSFTLLLLGITGLMALFLGVIGIYGVISYIVSQRRREIGIRLALGAQQPELRRMFVNHALTLTGLGVIIGLASAAGLTRMMKSLLFGISPLDPITYAVVPLVLFTAAALAGYLPARRASRVDPVETLKAE